MLGNMRIDFGRFDAAMTEQALDDADIGTGFQQMRSVAVAEHVQRDRAPNAMEGAHETKLRICPASHLPLQHLPQPEQQRKNERGEGHLLEQRVELLGILALPHSAGVAQQQRGAQ